MVPFLAKDLESLIRGLMRQCIKSSVLEEAGTVLKILKFDISNEENFDIQAFDPNLMATKPQLSLTKFKRLVSTMNDCKILTVMMLFGSTTNFWKM